MTVVVTVISVGNCAHCRDVLATCVAFTKHTNSLIKAAQVAETSQQCAQLPTEVIVTTIVTVQKAIDNCEFHEGHESGPAVITRE